MTSSLLAGAVVGAGLFLLVRVLARPRPGVATLVARIDAGRRSMTGYTATPLEVERGQAGGRRTALDRLADRLEVLAAEHGWQLNRVRADLAIVNRTVGSLLAAKVATGVVMFLIAPVSWAAMRSLGVTLPTSVPLVIALALGLLGFFLPDLALRGEAARRRAGFRRSVGIFLDLVAMNLAGGRGLPEALLAASTISDHWSVVRIRQALANARLFGTTPWQALGVLGEEVDVEELRDLSGALALAADDGAKIRVSLAARAATIRRKQLSDAEGEAGEKSQSMLVAQLLICTAFLVFLGYPAVARLMGMS
ncbi:MAG: type II secretion system protein [Actinomycetales bacterium]|nr:type II secretion system protein [Actinomycetales bacterium]